MSHALTVIYPECVQQRLVSILESFVGYPTTYKVVQLIRKTYYDELTNSGYFVDPNTLDITTFSVLYSNLDLTGLSKYKSISYI